MTLTKVGKCHCGRCERRRNAEKQRRASLRRRRSPCRHCHARPAGKSRGLCWRCFYDPRVRCLYQRMPYREAGRPHEQRKCPVCGCLRWNSSHEDSPCGVCLLEEPLRSVVSGRIALYEWLAENGLPLFILRGAA